VHVVASTDGPGRLRSAFGNVLLVAVLYAAAGFLMLFLARFTGLAAPLWPAAGLAFAAVHQRGRYLAIGVVLGSFAVNFGTIERGEVSSTFLLLTAVGIACGAGLQALVGDGLVSRYVGRERTLDSTGQILAFLALAGPVACVVNATVGVVVELSTGVVDRSDALIGWVTWWAGDAMGVIVFAPIVLMLLPELDDIWDGRRWKVAVPSVLATVVVLGGFVFNRNLDDTRVTMREQQVADQAVDALRLATTRQDEVLQGVGAFVSSSEFVSADEFRSYVSGALARNPSLQAVSWNQVVPAASLDAFVAQQRAQPGLAGFQVTEKDASGALVPAAARPEYVVVAYIEPVASNRAALGYDIWSNDARRAAAIEARDTGLITSTPPIELVQETGTQKGMLVLEPVYAGGAVPAAEAGRRRAIVGYATGVVRIGDLVTSTVEGPQWDQVGLTLTDVTAASAPVVLASKPALDGASTVGGVREEFDLNGRTWKVDVALTGRALADIESANVAVLLVASVLVIGLLEAFLLLVTGVERRTRREAEAYGYEAVHDPLTDLLNRRGFRRALRAAQERGTSDGSEHYLMYLDLDGFRDVNNAGGHEAGDRLLHAVGQAVQAQVRRGDAVGRMGGDEFAVLLVDCDVEHGTAIAQQIVEAVKAAVVGDLAVTVSVGAIAVTVLSPPDVDALLRAADDACFDAKHAGGSQVRVSAPRS
jgi:diguanylate cyclase